MSSLNHHKLTAIKCKCHETIKINLYTLRHFTAVFILLQLFLHDSIQCPPTSYFVIRLSVTQIEILWNHILILSPKKSHKGYMRNRAEVTWENYASIFDNHGALTSAKKLLMWYKILTMIIQLFAYQSKALTNTTVFWHKIK